MSVNLRVKSSQYIDETTRVSFKFNGTTYYGFKGDTLASALLANNVHLVGRSFKYHRPRGIMTSGSEEPNAIVQINPNTNRTEPNVRATEVEIYEGMEASSQNCWPSVNFDIGGINNFLSPFFPAGFYYKTFMWPASFWEKYEYFIRHSAGLGKSPTLKDPDIYDHRNIHCDVLVVGAGISGILAAKNAAKNNYKTLLLDEKNELGGSTIYENYESNKIDNKISSEWLKKEIEELKDIKNLEIKTRTSVAAYHQYNYLLARENLTDHLEKKDKINKIDQRVFKLTPFFFSYTLSKTGLYTLTKTSAMSLSPRIRVNGIAPGPTIKNKRQSEKHFKSQYLATPLKQQVDVNEICNAVDFFIKNSSITGQVLAIDCGQNLNWQTPDVIGKE